MSRLGSSHGPRATIRPGSTIKQRWGSSSSARSGASAVSEKKNQPIVRCPCPTRRNPCCLQQTSHMSCRGHRIAKDLLLPRRPFFIGTRADMTQKKIGCGRSGRSIPRSTNRLRDGQQDAGVFGLRDHCNLHLVHHARAVPVSPMKKKRGAPLNLIACHTASCRLLATLRQVL